MSQKKEFFIRDLVEDKPVSAPFLVKFVNTSVGKTGKSFMSVVLMDKTGECEARIWDDIPKFTNQVVRDAFVWIEGRCQLFQGRKQIVIKGAQVLREDEVDPKDYIAESTLDPEALYAELMSYVSSMKDPYYRALAESVLRDDADIVDRVKRAPAAKSMHHAYRAGLIEHVVSIVKMLDFLSGHYAPYVDRDLLFLGGFFHDICN
jgi:3'-5' exoribonuclease